MTRDRLVAWFALVALALYIGSWVVAGAVREGYDPVEQAISELFELGAPWASRGLLLLGLGASGLAFVAFGPTLHRVLPGRGRLGPALVVIAGIGTLGVMAAPCQPGCPGAGTSATDTWHTVAAGVGYTALATAPLAVAWRLRHDRPSWAGWSAGLGGLAVLLFVVYLLDLVAAAGGLQQRLFNTVADVWYAVAAVWVLHLTGDGQGSALTPRGRRAAAR